MQFMLDLLAAEGFEVELRPLPQFKCHVIVTRKNQRCLDTVRHSRKSAIRCAYFLFVQHEAEILNKLTLAERQDVLRVRQEMAAS